MNKVIVVEKKTKDYKQINSTANGEKKQRRQQKKQRNDNQSSNILIYMIIGMLIILITTMFGILYINKYVKLNKINSKINQVKQEIETLSAKKQKMKLQISQYKSLGRVEKVAKTQLEMIEPEDIKYITMNQQETTDSKNKPIVDSTTKKFKLSKLSQRVTTWLQELTKVEAGTLEE